MAHNNDDMAGIVSEPSSGEGSDAPEVRPDKPLWPRPHDEVVLDESSAGPERLDRVEPVLGGPASAPVSDPRVDAPAETRVEPVIEAAPVQSERPVAEQPHQAAAAAAEPERVRVVQEPAPANAPLRVDAPSVASENLAAAAGAGVAPPVSVFTPRESAVAPELAAASRVHGTERAPSDRAHRSAEAAPRRNRFLYPAVAALALLLGGGGLIYAMSGGERASQTAASDTAAGSNAAPAAVPASAASTDPTTASAEDLRLIRDHLDQIEKRFARLESQIAGKADKGAAPAAGAGEQQRLNELATRLDRLERAPRSAAAPTAPAETPTPGTPAAPRVIPITPTAENAGAIPAPTSPPAQPEAVAAAAPEPINTPTPPAVPQPRPATARAEPRPEPAAPAPAPTPTPAAPSTPRVAAASPDAPVVSGWQVRDVYNGMAVLQSRRGLMEVTAGDELPDGNRVLAIRRLGGKWVVVTEQGLIASAE